MNGPLDGARVVIVNNFPGPGLGGGEVQALALGAGLMAAGAELRAVVVEGSGFGAALRAMGVAVVEAEMSPSALGAGVKAIARELEGPAPAIALGTGYWTNILVRLAARGGAARVVNLVGVTPGASLTDGGSALGLAASGVVDRATASGVDAYVAVSHSIAAALIERGARAERVHVIANGVDADKLVAASHGPLPAGVPEGRPLVVCVARLEPVKGVDVLVRATALLPGVVVAVAGDGPEEAALRELAAALGVAGRVTFLGRVSPVAPLLAAADVVALPSRSEGMPIVALEAMALSRPVVASRVGGVGEAVADGKTGVLVAPNDPAALAAALGRVTGDPSAAAAMGEAGEARVAASFGSRTMADAYVALFAELLGG